jgi:hypothetical protein
MARKRMIDPAIWTDEGMAELTPRQQLLYIGLFSNADDAGRIRGSPSSVRLTLPTVYGGVSLEEVAADLNAVLREMRQLVAYEEDGRLYLVFRNYLHWQKIEHPSKSTLPAPPDPVANGHATFPDPSANIHRGLPEGSPSAPRGVDEPSGSVRSQYRLVKEELVELDQDRAAAAAGTARGRAREATAAASAPEQSADTRAFLHEWRAAQGKRHPLRLNPRQQTRLDTAMSDLGLPRLLEAINWTAGEGIGEISKCISAAYTKRRQDEEGTHGTARRYPAATGRGRRAPERQLSADQRAENAKLDADSVASDDPRLASRTTRPMAAIYCGTG